MAGDDQAGKQRAGAAEMLDPSPIMQLGFGFMSSKALLSAVELDLFTTLGSGPLTGPAIAERLELRSRAVYDYLDALVALRMLERDGQGEAGFYRNTVVTGRFLDRNSASYIGGLLEQPVIGLTRREGVAFGVHGRGDADRPVRLVRSERE